MTRLWTSGLESGVAATEGLIFFGTPTFDATARTGVNSVLIANGANRYAERPETTTLGRSYYLRFYFRTSGSPAALAVLLDVYDTASGANFTLRLNTSRQIQLWDFGGGSVIGTSAALTVDAWHRVEVEVRQEAAGTGILEFRLDGTTVVRNTAVAVGNTAINRFRFGNRASASVDFRYDDFALNDNQGVSNNSWVDDPGPSQTLRPDADTVTTGWTLPPFIKDTFTDTDGDNVRTAHTPEIGSWVDNASWADPVINTNRAVGSGSFFSVNGVTNSVTPPSADYEVEFTVRRLSAGAQAAMVTLRTDATGQANAYQIGFDINASGFVIQKRTAGAGGAPDSGTAAYADAGFTAGVERTLIAQIEGTTLKLWVDGTLRITATDNDFSAAGLIGFFLQADAGAQDGSNGLAITQIEARPVAAALYSKINDSSDATVIASTLV